MNTRIFRPKIELANLFAYNYKNMCDWFVDYNIAGERVAQEKMLCSINEGGPVLPYYLAEKVRKSVDRFVIWVTTTPRGVEIIDLASSKQLADTRLAFMEYSPRPLPPLDPFGYKPSGASFLPLRKILEEGERWRREQLMLYLSDCDLNDQYVPPGRRNFTLAEGGPVLQEYNLLSFYLEPPQFFLWITAHPHGVRAMELALEKLGLRRDLFLVDPRR